MAGRIVRRIGRIKGAVNKKFAKLTAANRAARIEALKEDIIFLDRRIYALHCDALKYAGTVRPFGEKSEAGRLALERRAQALEDAKPLEKRRDRLRAKFHRLDGKKPKQ
jgi:hypothetical protein